MAATALFFMSVACFAQNVTDPLKKGFENPPSSARPRVWWHWMNGNITQEGIKLDLEWMHRVGIAGYQNFDAALQTPQVVDKRLAYMTPEWKQAFKYAITLGNQFGMEMAIAGSPGWSESGGPWVPPSQGMKKYVWSETPLDGGQPFMGKLVPPPGTTGAFQNIGIREQFGPPAAPPSTVLRGCCSSGLPPACSSLRRKSGATENHCQRRGSRPRNVERRRPGKNHKSADSRSRFRSPGSFLNIPPHRRFAL